MKKEIATEAYVNAAAGLWIAERINRFLDEKLRNTSKITGEKTRALAAEIFAKVGHGILDEVISCLTRQHSDEEERDLEAKCEYIASLAISIECSESMAKKTPSRISPRKSTPSLLPLPVKRTLLKKEHWEGIVKRKEENKFFAVMLGPDGERDEKMFLKRNHLGIWQDLNVGTRFAWNVKRRATGQVRESEINLSNEYEDTKND